MQYPVGPEFRRALFVVLFVDLVAVGGCGAPLVEPPEPVDLAVAADLARVDTAVPIDAAVVDAGTIGDIGDGSSGPVTLGATDRLLLYGTIVTADDPPNDVITGAVLVEGTTITCVAPGDGCRAMPGAVGATIVDTQGVITPGLIDTHNHILFDIFDDDDWIPTAPTTNHNSWTTDPRYQALLDVKQCLADDPQGKPVWCANTVYGTASGSLRCEMDKYGELKGLIAGTTSIVGLPGTSSACFSSVARSIDVPQSGLSIDTIQTSAIFPPSKASGDSVCTNLASGATHAYLIHCGEGTDAQSQAEFATLGSLTTKPNCLYAPQTTITHGTAFTAAEFTTMGQTGMKLTWSPRSNVSLYGATTDIPTALAKGVTVSIAPDWSMGGSQNILDELRFARAWDQAHWGGLLSNRQLVQMVTTNAASVLALSDRLGKIAPGYLADLSVFHPPATPSPSPSAYDAVLAAAPRDVALVLVGGSVLYGDAQLAAVGRAQHPGCEMLNVCGNDKFVCVATGVTANRLNQSYAEIKGAIESALVAADAQTAADGWNFSPITPLVKCSQP